MPLRSVPAAALAAGIVAGAGGAAAEPDVARGAALAQDRCAECHDVSSAGAFKTYPPSFASVATFRAPEQIAARILFPQLHGPMLQGTLYLRPEDVDDLVAFIASLERPAP